MGATAAFTYYDDGLRATTTAKQVTQSNGSKKDIVLESSAYDGAGNLTAQTASGGRTTVNTVDATGRVTRSVFDPNGLNRVTTAVYDGDNRITEQTQSIDSSGKKLTSTTEYDGVGNPKKATVTDGTGTRVTSSTFDQRGLPLTQVTPAATPSPTATTPSAAWSRRPRRRCRPRRTALRPRPSLPRPSPRTTPSARPPRRATRAAR